MTNPPEDEIVEEIRGRREAHARALGFDLKKIIADLRRQEEQAGVPVVVRPPRKPQQTPKRDTA